MNETPTQPSPQATSASVTFNPLSAIRLFRSAGGALLGQAALYGKLAKVEWAEEKNRLVNIALLGLVAIACLLCTMLFIGVLVLALSWDTTYRIPAVLAMIAVYGIGLVIAWFQLRSLSALNEKTFAATREEFAADLAMIKSKL